MNYIGTFEIHQNYSGIAKMRLILLRFIEVPETYTHYHNEAFEVI